MPDWPREGGVHRACGLNSAHSEPVPLVAVIETLQ